MVSGAGLQFWKWIAGDESNNMHYNYIFLFLSKNEKAFSSVIIY